MNLEIYSKDLPEEYDFEKSKRKDRIFAATLSIVGLVAVLFAAGPILIWSFTSLSLFGSKIGNSPIPNGEVLAIQDENIDVQVKEDEGGFSYFTTTYSPTEKRPENFYVTIPKLGIKKAVAKVDSLDFYKNLSHFPGTALPGEVGNVFITGHSVLPQFAKPEDYNTIFTKLPDLDVGDIVDIDFEENKYRYVVQYKKVVNPKDLSVLKPISRGAKNLTLMTCVPPGTSLKRMVVVTSLI